MSKTKDEEQLYDNLDKVIQNYKWRNDRVEYNEAMMKTIKTPTLGESNSINTMTKITHTQNQKIIAIMQQDLNLDNPCDKNVSEMTSDDGKIQGMDGFNTL